MGNMQMLDKVRQINALHVKLFAEFLQKLKNTPEGDSNLLDQSLIVYGSGLSDGNVHTHDQLPTLLCGPRRQLRHARPPHHLSARDAGRQPLRHHDRARRRAPGARGRFHRAGWPDLSLS